jgi:signal transduction histidine kinase
MNLIKLLHTSTFRLALLYMVLFSSSVFILFSFIYWEMVGYMAMQTDATIILESEGLTEQYRHEGIHELIAVINERIQKNPNDSSIYLLTGHDYIPLAGNLRRWPLVQETSEGWLNFPLKNPMAKSNSLSQVRAYHFRLSGGRFHLLVGKDVQELNATQNMIIHALGWGLTMTVGLALLGGLMMSWSTVRRVEVINQTCRDIMTGNLTRRIPNKGIGDDFDQLGDNLNAMLDRIETLMAGVRQVADNIAHDLRTPLTRLRNRLEQLRGQVTDNQQCEELIEKNIAEADQLLATFNALLRIAQIESGSRLNCHIQVNLVTLVQDAAELYEVLAHEKNQSFTLHLAGRDILVCGDRDLLFQALANLLDNAVKYTPIGGHIHLSLTKQENVAEIRIVDTGPGIPEEAKTKVFERFFRLESSRNTPGNGLGLSLVVAVAKLHHSQIRLEDNVPTGVGVVWMLNLVNSG